MDYAKTECMSVLRILTTQLKAEMLPYVPRIMKNVRSVFDNMLKKQ
jgi:hypothetical protein